jgi:hypothetical protein
MTISQTRLANFRDLLQAAVDRYFRITFPSLTAPNISFGGGKKYLKVVKTDDSGSSSVWGFIALSDNPAKGVTEGDLLMASSWKAPALNGARGTILDENVISKVNPYSTGYKGCESSNGWGAGVDVSDLVLTD